MEKMAEKPKLVVVTPGLEESVKGIIKFVEKLPLKYQKVTYEKLLENTIDAGDKKQAAVFKTQESYEFRMPIEAKAFLAQFKIPEGDIYQYFTLVDHEKLAPIYAIKTSKASRAQIQIACLLALEHALHDGKFEFSIEDVKDKCMIQKCYNANNFMPYFRKNNELFESLDDYEHVVLSSAGAEHLADILDELSDKTQDSI